ncbi:MAG: HlyD family secretion protein [Acidobacteriia bacterium]|nr:HlyD family secretion protein [Terriglobia bacterium]
MASHVQELEQEAIIHPKEDAGSPSEVKTEQPPKATTNEDRRHKLLGQIKAHPLLAVLTVTVLIIGSASLWLYLSSYEQTDDAQVDGHLHPISARVSGTVLSVNPDAQNNHYVEAGTVLAELDPADYSAEVDRARADFGRLQATASGARQEISVISSGSTGHLELAEAQVKEATESVAAEKAAQQAAEARLTLAEANHARAEADRRRYESLLAKREISQSEYDRIATESSTFQATVIAARADVSAARLRVDQAESRLTARRADLLAARSAPEQISSSKDKAAAAGADADRAHAQLTTAQLNLSYTKIIAPVSGIIGRKSVEVGQRIQPGQQLMIIIPVDDVWITANFKETQLRKMKPGQAVTIHADSFDQEYHGHVDSIGGATGSMFSLLPPENATGNFVKVVQRVPVKILLNPGENADHRLRPGMSVEPKVRIK